MGDPEAAEPQFSEDRRWWWTGREWVPASQAPLPEPNAGGGQTSNADHSIEAQREGWLAQKRREAHARRLARQASSRHGESWLASTAKKAQQAAAASAERAAQVKREQAERQAAQESASDRAFAAAQAACPLPLTRSRDRLPGGAPLLADEFLVSTAKHWGFSSERLALTTHRLVWSRGRVNRDSQQVYLTDIREVAYHKPAFGTGSITVEAANPHSMEGLVHMKHAQQFRDSLMSMVHYAKQRSQQVMVQVATPPSLLNAAVAAPDKFDQLRKLAELKAQGILTDEEFATEKAKLLAG